MPSFFEKLGGSDSDSDESDSEAEDLLSEDEGDVRDPNLAQGNGSMFLRDGSGSSEHSDQEEDDDLSSDDGVPNKVDHPRWVRRN